ncbi:MAG TPA: DNA polymerase IV, partial [Terriglobales bacterium]|nr:DNA polymerase IV [Terriglobales bacterium]
LDEAFLDISGSLKLFGGACALAQELKRQVRAETGLTISVGVGPTKMIAKIASDLRKPDGLVEVPADEAVDFLRPLPVSRLWGVGPVTLARLESIGIRTIGDVELASPARLESAIGSLGAFLQALARGEDPRDVSPDRQRKSYGEENTFEQDLRDGPRLRSVIREHAEAIARRLRGDQRVARTVVLKLKLTNRVGPGKYPILTRRQTLEMATDDGTTIAEAALALWDKAHQGRAVRLIGVAATEMQAAANASQLGLFDDGSRRKQSALNRALDQIQARYGNRAVARGSRSPQD